MPAFENHPTVLAMKDQPVRGSPPALDADELRRLCLDAGAEDAGFVAINRPELDDQREDILRFFPATRTLISLVGRMNPEPIRNPARSVANLEFHGSSDALNHTSRLLVAKLALRGVRAINPPVGFPMEMTSFPGKVWVVSHKPVAVAAGLGQMGVHRNVIHPRLGSFILLATVLIDAEVSTQSTPIDYNPCLDCRLCVAACPVGAIAPDGFNFSACYTHNYREFMGGFADWVEKIADSADARDYRARVSDGQTASMWQSLATGPNYKAAYCLSVCPAGSDVIAPFIADRPRFVNETVRPLVQKVEEVFVQAGSDAEAHVAKRFPHKKLVRVGAGVLRPTSIAGFIRGMQHVFQPGQSQGLDATYHFTFTGDEQAECTVTIRDQRIEVRSGHAGDCDIRITASSRAWLKFLRGETGVLAMLLTRRLKIRGDPRLLAAFGRCFPR